ncbi:MAG: hypothetical protein KDK78_01820 [Chlamydiia bacterium]|nr:hypothetical protein [Chlamydiia bacterium]
MNKNITRILDEYKADELGLPVVIRSVPVIDLAGEEVLDINYAQVSAAIFSALILKPYRLTGSEVKFMRLFMELTLEGLAKKLHVTHPSVLSWERCEQQHTNMSESTEALLRILAAQQSKKDQELISVVLDTFFHGKYSEEDGRVTTIVELNPASDSELPQVRFSLDPELQSASEERQGQRGLRKSKA